MYLSTFGVAQLSTIHLPPRHLLLLAYLAAEGTVSRARLRSVFWPNHPTAAASLRVALSELRRTAPTLIAERGDRLIMQAGSDLADFLGHVQAGRSEAALELYRGPFLADLPAALFGPELEEWLLETRESLAEQLWESLMHAAEGFIGQGQTIHAGQHAEAAWQLPALTPRDEHDLQRLHRVLVASGSLQAGLVAREARQLGVEIEATSPAIRETPRPSALKPALPTEVTPFVGQLGALKQLAGWLAEPDIRLVTILGAGGAGKTRLALQAARQARQVYQERVWWISLEDLSHPDGLFAHIALALGMPLSPGISALETLAGVLADKAALIVLDQFEHLSGAAPLVADLLGLCPDLKVLVTSRHRLLMRAEVTFELRGLEVNTSSATAHSDALTLFLQQARRVRPSYRFSDADLRHAQEVCALVDGMPLAIELSANWIRLLTPGQMLAELRSNLNLLDLPIQDLPERHRNLRLVLEQSWQRLSGRDREVLTALAVFHGGFTVRAATSVTGATLRELQILVDKSMLRVDDTGRFSWHPLIAQFSRQRLHETPERQAALETMHTAYFLDLSGKRWFDILDGHRQLEWRTWFSVEYPNLTAALRSAIDRSDFQGAAYLSRNLVRERMNRGVADIGLDTVLALLPHLEGQDDLDARAWALISAELLAMYGGVDVSALHLDAVKAARQTNDNFTLMIALYIREYGSQQRGDPGHAALLAETYDTAVRTGQKGPLATALRRRASVALSQGDGAAALADLARGLSLVQHLGVNNIHADLLLLMGQLQVLQGELNAAWQSFETAHHLFSTLGLRPEASTCLDGLALTCLFRAGPGNRLENLHLALRWCDEADRVFKPQARYAVRDNINMRGFVLSALGRLPEAEVCLTGDVQAARRCSNHQGELIARLGLGGVALRRQDWGKAKAEYESVVNDSSRQSGHMPARWLAQYGLAEAQKQLGEQQAAQVSLEDAQRLGHGLGAVLPPILSSVLSD